MATNMWFTVQLGIIKKNFQINNYLALPINDKSIAVATASSFIETMEPHLCTNSIIVVYRIFRSEKFHPATKNPKLNLKIGLLFTPEVLPSIKLPIQKHSIPLNSIFKQAAE